MRLCRTSSTKHPLSLCTNSVCRFAGHFYPHVCFSERPVPGAGPSATAAQAIPIKMASRISQDPPHGEWEPPKPKPEYEHPDRSGRILLANQHGASPTHGPGVDECTVSPYRPR